MIFFICICLWLMLQGRQLAKAYRAKAEADHRLRLAQLELMRALERHLGEISDSPRGELFLPGRLGAGRN